MSEKPNPFYGALLVNYLRDAQSIYLLSTAQDLDQDCKTVMKMIEDRGWPFLYKTLKAISDGLLELLETRKLPRSMPFRVRKGTILPLFLGAYWSRVCDLDGNLLPDPDIAAIKVLYQVSSMFAKIELPYDKSIMEEFLDKFVDTDASLRFPYTKSTNELLSVATNIVTEIMKDVDLSDIRPKHGPGAVASGARQEEKWNLTTIFLRADEAYPFMENFYMNTKHLIGELIGYSSIPIREDSHAKFHAVPKTALTPRGICIEPQELQFLQQGQMRILVDRLESHNWTRGQVNFRSQAINANLALESSRTRDFATIDLSEASDRLSLQLVRELFQHVPEVLYYLEATRSSYVDLPDGRVVRLKKFAPMGSAVCFPIESVCFFAISVAACFLASPGISVPQRLRHCYAYGDDIIVPSAQAEAVVAALTQVGLKVNTGKSYWRGHFRESCGMHAYNGMDITPVRIKALLPVKVSDGRAVESYLAYAHAFDRMGFGRTAEYIYRHIEELLKVQLPFAPADSGFLSRLCDDLLLCTYLNSGRVKRRWNRNLQCFEYNVLFLGNRYRAVSYKDGWHRLMRSQLQPDPFGDPSKVVLLRSTKIKRGWRP